MLDTNELLQEALCSVPEPPSPYAPAINAISVEELRELLLKKAGEAYDESFVIDCAEKVEVGDAKLIARNLCRSHCL